MGRQADIFYYLGLYKRQRFLMSFLIIAAALFTAVKASREPAAYRSVASVLLLERESTATFFEQALGGEGGGFSQDLIHFILTSRRMKNDIDSHFNIAGRRGVWWSLRPFRTGPGSCFSVAVIGSDPELTKSIANFAIENLDRLNLELQITSLKPMVRVIDPADRGVKQSRPVLKKSLFSALFVFLVYSIYIFLADYLRAPRR